VAIRTLDLVVAEYRQRAKACHKQAETTADWKAKFEWLGLAIAWVGLEKRAQQCKFDNLIRLPTASAVTRRRCRRFLHSLPFSIVIADLLAESFTGHVILLYGLA
jgi:hypothetical protein